MKKENNIITHRLRLTTLTPVSIGGDQSKPLSPYSDYVFSDDGKRLLYLNQQAILEGFTKNGSVDKALIDQYVAGIYDRMDNNRSNFDLKKFVRETLKLPLEKPYIRRSVPVEGLTANQRLPISPVAKSAGDPYLPGSSIKGAIRTAMLYHWLVKSEEGEEAMGYLEKDLDRIRKIRKDNPNPRRMSFDARKDLRNLENKFFPEEKLLGSLWGQGGPDARRIRVSDTNVREGGLQVHKFSRIRLTPPPRMQQGNSEIPIVREVFFSEQPLDFTVSVLPDFDSKALRYWEEQDTGDILALLNSFTTAALSNEIYELEDAPGGNNPEVAESLLDFYQQLYTRAKAGEVFLRLGFGKTIYDNSLALSMLNGIEPEDAGLDAFDTYRQHFWRMNRNARTYPATRTVTPGGLPLGWVKVETNQL